MELTTLGLTVPEKRSNPLNNPSVPLSSPAVWGLLSGDGRGTEAGESVSWESSLQILTVFACVRVLAESIASLPIRLYTLTDRGRMVDYSHPLAHLLSFEPNSEMSSVDWVETVVSHLMISGNSYTQIERSTDGVPIGLWPLNPRKTEPVRLPNGNLAYRTSDGETGGRTRIIAAKDVLHPRLMSWDGLLGLSPVLQAKRSLGLAVAAEKYASRLFSNAGVPTLALSTEQQIKPEVKQQMRADWLQLQTGDNQHKIAILDSALKPIPLALTAEESQFLESRKYTRSDIAALFKIPPHYVGELSKMSNSNTEQQNLSFVIDTLRPLVSRLEAEISRKLLPREPGQPSKVQIQFDLTERLRGDFASQTTGASVGRNWGWLTANDVRRSFGLNEGGPELDVYLNPVNMQNSTALLKPTTTPTEEGTNV
jgi:HK97 family phage portal protein